MNTSPSIDWTTIAVTTVGLGWGTWYVLATRWNPIDEPEAAWLITPVAILAWMVAPFVVLSAIGPLPERLQVDPDEGLDRPNRWLFALGLPVLAGLIWVLGFVLAIILYVSATVVAMGERRVPVHLAILGVLLAIIFGGFVWGLGVDLPLWPGDLWPRQF